MISLMQWKNMLKEASLLLIENFLELCHIDSQIGDGDHGITIKRIAEIIMQKVNVDYVNAADLFDDIGFAVINVQGGSAGPLWGTFLSGMGVALRKEPAASAADVFASGLAELQTITMAKEGDKTMMDAIYPAISAMKKAKNDASALENGAKAAKEGAEKTVSYVAKFGRAKNYGKRSIGVKDAGACSISLFFEGINAGYKKPSL